MQLNEWVITSQSALERALEGVGDVIGLDTEFRRRDTFFPIPCLVQIASKEKRFLIDLQAPLNLLRLEALLMDETITKIMHAPSEDLDVLHYLFGGQVKNLVDIQLAHAFASGQISISYTDLVSIYTGIDYLKDEATTVSDWRKRPLTEAQVKYALRDVEYLATIWEELKRKLDELGRRSWFEEEMQSYRSGFANFTLSDVDESQSRSSASKSNQATYCRVLEWRESFARKIDRPRHWVAPKGALIDSVENYQRGTEYLTKAYPKMNASLIQEKVIRAHKSSKRLKSYKVGMMRTRRQVLNPSEQRALSKINSLLSQLSAELKLPVSLLAPKQKVLCWMKSYRQNQQLPASFGKWRETIMGSEIRSLLET